ncbi:MAG: acylphosphatase [Devosia sp.]
MSDTLEGIAVSRVEGGDPVRVRYAISGRMNVSEYLDFIVERADWLAIDGWASADDQGRVTLVAAGPEALVGALEMACTLGPLTALVESILAEDESAEVGSGFALRS